MDHDKSSFWKKNVQTVPGRPSMKRDSKPSSKSKGSASMSFQDFQSSVRDAWEVDDDELCIISGHDSAKISKKVSQSAAINVLNSHRIIPNSKLPQKTVNTIPPSMSDYLEIARCSPVPGRPQQMRFTKPPRDDESESRIKRFETYLSNSPSLQGLRELSWSGIPTNLRPIVWRMLSGLLPMNLERRNNVLNQKRQDYWGLVNKYYYTDHNENERDTKHQIHIDVQRMNPMVPLFRDKIVQLIFERILFIWSTRHPASGYVQGMNDLATPFYLVFLQEYIPANESFETFDVSVLSEETLKIIEADSFWCLSKFLDGIQDNYVFAQMGIQKKVLQLEDLITRVDETLHCHLKSHNISYLQFSFRWLNNLLTRELPLRCIIRLWDTYLAESDNFALFQLYVCAAFLLNWKEDLMRQNDFQGLLIFLQNLPTHVWSNSQVNLLVAEAYKLKYIFADAPNHLQNKRAEI